MINQLDNTAYLEEMALWKGQRNTGLKNPDGYLSLVGLYWLQQGENSFGSAVDSRCQFPAELPPKIGHFSVSDAGISVEINPDVPVTSQGKPVTSMPVLADRDKGGPTIFEWETFSWFIIKRGDVICLRLRDSNSEFFSKFSQVDRFPINVDYRIQGSSKRYDQPKTIPVPNIIGVDDNMVSLGMLEITVSGEDRELVALRTGDKDRLFLIIADGSSGNETYGGGRFITTEPVDSDGNVVVDFNKATNPPCAFTPWATCPRPPEGNRFNVKIPAGEKVYKY